jgi:membrane protein
MMHGVSVKQFLLDLKQEAVNDNMFNGAAALAFYLTLSIFPALILLLSIVPYLPIARVDQAIMDLLGQALPAEAYGMVQQVVMEVTGEQRGGLLSFGLLGTLWAASTGMYGTMQQLNITYGAKEGRSFLRGRATALLLSLLFGAMVLAAFALIVFGGIVQDWIGHRFGFSDPLLLFFAGFRWVVIVLALLLGFAMIYRYAPNVERRFSFLSPGSAVGVTLIIIASVGFAIYTRNFGDYSATYGSVGAMIALMLWLYLVALVLLLGSEINVLLARYESGRKRKSKQQASREM